MWDLFLLVLLAAPGVAWLAAMGVLLEVLMFVRERKRVRIWGRDTRPWLNWCARAER